MLSTRQLHYFDALARHRHFGRAAAECAVTQPALSMQIRELENMLGVALVERGRPLRLTAAGAEVARRAAAILADIAALEEFAAGRRTPLSGRLRLGVIPTIAPYLLPALLPALSAAHPGLALEIRETLTDHLLRDLEDGAIDVALLALPVHGAGIETLPLFEDVFVLASPGTAARTSGPRADAAGPDGQETEAEGEIDAARLTARLAGAPLLLLEEGHCLRDQALKVCAAGDMRAARTFGASSLSTLVQMVAAGLGHTLLPEMSVPVETACGNVELRRFAPPAPVRQIGLAFRARSPLRPDAEALGEIILQIRAATRSPVSA